MPEGNEMKIEKIQRPKLLVEVTLKTDPPEIAFINPEIIDIVLPVEDGTKIIATVGDKVKEIYAKDSIQEIERQLRVIQAVTMAHTLHTYMAKED